MLSLNAPARDRNVRQHSVPTRAFLILLMAWLMLCPGCVRRRLTVRTNPPGASVYVDKQLIGTTPTATAFTYYGTREIEVIADGYRTEKVLRTISPPWYQIPPLDFLAETLWPWELKDERVVDITLVPEQPLTSEVLLARADKLRLQASQGIATPLSVPVNLPPAVLPPAYIRPPEMGSGFDRPPPQTSGPVWVPGQALHHFLQPGGQLPQRIPEAGILGGAYRPELGP